MSVLVRYFYDKGVQGLGSFPEDLATSYADAANAGDRPAMVRLRDLWLDHLEIDLRLMSVSQFDAYLAVRRPTWREHDPWQVVKTVDLPCIAYTAQINPAGIVTIYALGAAYRYPNQSEDSWWTDVILPRVRSFGT